MPGKSFNRRHPYPLALFVLFFYALVASGCVQGESAFIGDADGYNAPKDESPEPTACPDSPRELFNNGDTPYRWGEGEVMVEVNFVEDLRCPYCIDFSLSVQELLQRRTDFQKNVRLYFHHFPLEQSHPGTTEIHVAAAAASGQSLNYFWALYDEIMLRGSQGDRMKIEEVEDFLAKQSDFDMKRFRADMSASRAKDFVQWDMMQSSRAGVNGTPTVFVCNKALYDWRALEEAIDDLL